MYLIRIFLGAFSVRVILVIDNLSGFRRMVVIAKWPVNPFLGWPLVEFDAVLSVYERSHLYIVEKLF